MSKHSIRIGRLSRFSASRSSSSASTRRCRCRLGHERVGLQRERRVLLRQVDEPALLAPLGLPHLDRRSAPLGQELLERGHVARSRAARRARAGRGRGRVVLDAERLEHVGRGPGPRRSRDGTRSRSTSRPSRSGKSCTAARSPPIAIPITSTSPHAALLGGLPLGEVPDREQPVAVARRLLEALRLGRLAHPRLEPALDRLRVAGEEADDAVDDLAVLGAWDVADAGRVAAVDVVVEARHARVPARLRPLARAELEDAVEHVERLAHLLRVRVRPEVEDAAAGAAPA